MIDGRGAEDAALAFLQKRGLRLLARNFRCRGGELDLVMAQGQSLVIVEVRARTRDDYGSAAESVGGIKRRRLTHAAGHFLAQHPEWAQAPVRFDIVALDGSGRLDWLQDAFEVNE